MQTNIEYLHFVNSKCNCDKSADNLSGRQSDKTVSDSDNRLGLKEGKNEDGEPADRVRNVSNRQ